MSGPDLVERQLEALSSPTRRAAYRLLLDRGGPCTVAEVADRLEITPNMARRHLQVLADADLVDEQTEHRLERGRPRRLYIGRRDALPGWGAEGAIATVARLLAEVNRDGADPYEVAFRAAAEAGGRAGDAVDRLWLSLLVAGFEPCVPGERADQIVLRSCPVHSVAEVDPPTVCTLHRGLIDGLLGHPHATSLAIRPPRRAGCIVGLPGGATVGALARACDP